MKRNEGRARSNREVSLVPPVRGLDAVDALATMTPKDAVILENWIAYPDRVQMRSGASNHATGFTQPVKSLHTYNGLNGANKLFATCDNGIFDATAGGAIGAAVSAITQGYTNSVILSTGGTTSLFICNGTDDIRTWNGAAWTVTAAWGGLATNTIFAVENYKNRIFALTNNSLDLWYLPVNSVTGAATQYALNALFRRGGYLTAIATWTVDSGTGPDDMLVVMTNVGEVAVFSGTDPASSWSLKGIYYIGRPIGKQAMFKWGGELLILTEQGIYPLSKALASQTVDKTQAITTRIQPLFTTLANSYGTTQGWQILAIPDVPMLLVNVPGTNQGVQLVMQTQSGGWSTFSGWPAKCWARMDNQVYYGGTDKVVRALTGYSDFDANITARGLSAYTNLGSARTKHVRMVRPMFTSNGPFTYTLGLSNDFQTDIHYDNIVAQAALSGSLWGTGLWGTALWSGASSLTREWRTIPDKDGTYKAIYFEISSKTATVSLQAVDLLVMDHGTF